MAALDKSSRASASGRALEASEEYIEEDMLYLEDVVLDAPYVGDVDKCELKVLKGSVGNETIRNVVSRPGIYQVVVELRAPSEDGSTNGDLIAVCKAYAIQWTEVADDLAELEAGWGGVDEVDFREAMSEVNASLRELSQLFSSNGRLEADRLAFAKANPNVWQRRAPMGTDEEEGRLQNIALMDYVLVSKQNRGRGIGKMLVDALKDNLQERYRTTHILSFPTALNVSKMEFDDLEDPRWYREQNASIRFHRQQGFRRLFGTKFFCFACEPNHAARQMTADEDERRDQTLGFT